MHWKFILFFSFPQAGVENAIFTFESKMMLAVLCRALNHALYFPPAPASALPTTPPLRPSPRLTPPPSSLHHDAKITSLKHARLTLLCTFAPQSPSFPQHPCYSPPFFRVPWLPSLTTLSFSYLLSLLSYAISYLVRRHFFNISPYSFASLLPTELL